VFFFKYEVSYKTEFFIGNIFIILVSLIFIFIRQKFIKFRIKNINYDKIVKSLFVIFFILQLYIFYYTYFETGWDSATLTFNARNIAKKGSHNVVNSNFIKYPLITIIGCMFLTVKPHTFMIVIAIYLVEFIKLITKFNFNKLKKSLTIILISSIFMNGFNFGIDKIYKRYGFKINKELKFSYSHFLMMGANPKTNGGYYLDDVKFYDTIETRKERKKH